MSFQSIKTALHINRRRFDLQKRYYSSKKTKDERKSHPWQDVVVQTFPEDKVITDPRILHGRARDHFWRSPYLKQLFINPYGPDHASSSSIVEVHTVDDMRKCAVTAYQKDMYLGIRGRGTGITTGAFNFGSGLLIDTSKMNRIIDIDASMGTITCEAGATISQIREVALSVGWDLRMYPTTYTAHDSTIGGFLQTSKYGIGSAEHGSVMDYGNIIDMKVVPITNEGRVVELDAADDFELVAGSLRSLGTSSLISEVTLALSPAQYWVDVGITFGRMEDAWNFAQQVWKNPIFAKREMVLMPSSILTGTLNQGERNLNIKFLKNRIPLAGHKPGDFVEQSKSANDKSNSLPDHPLQETEILILMSTNEVALPFLNNHVKKMGGHTIYTEHSRGGFGILEATTWQQTFNRINKYYTDAHYCHYEFELGEVSQMDSSRLQTKLDKISHKLTDSIRQMSTKHQFSIDETQFLLDDIMHRPAFSIEFVKTPEGMEAIGQSFFRVQTDSLDQLEHRLNITLYGMVELQKENVIGDLVNPSAYDPAKIFLDKPAEPGTKSHAELRHLCKSQFDPKGLLNPRKQPTTLPNL